jgi:hypothetical protein
MNDITYETVMAQILQKLREDQVTMGTDINPITVALMKKSVADIAASIPCSHPDIPGGQTFGHLALVLTGTEYSDLYNNTFPTATQLDTATWSIPTLAEPEPYDPAALNVTNAAQRAQMEATWKKKEEAYKLYNTISKAIVQAFVAVVPEESIISLKSKYVKYNLVRVQQLLTQLEQYAQQHDSTASMANNIAILQKQWNINNTGFATYIKTQEERKEILEDSGIPISDPLMVTYTVHSIYQTDLCTREEVTKWELKSKQDKTWANLKTYFGKINHNRTVLNSIEKTAGSLGYSEKEAANSLQEEMDSQRAQLEAEQQELAAMKAQLYQQLNQLKENRSTSKETAPAPTAASTEMELCKQLMSQLATLTQEVQSLKNSNVPNGGDKGNGKPRVPAWKCPTCKLMVRHKKENCPDTNPEKRKANWKPMEERIKLGIQPKEE